MIDERLTDENIKDTLNEIMQRWQYFVLDNDNEGLDELLQSIAELGISFSVETVAPSIKIASVRYGRYKVTGNLLQ